MNFIKKIRKFLRPVRKYCIKISSILLFPKSVNTARKCNQIISENGGNVSVIVLTEHIGDIIASQPVSDYLIRKENKRIIWIVNKKYVNIVRMLPAISYILPVSCLTEWVYARHFVDSKVIYNLHFNGRLCTKFYLKLSNDNKDITMENYYKRGNLLKMFFDLAKLPYSDEKPILKLPGKPHSILNLPKEYYVIHTSSNEECRNWDKDKWKEFMNLHPNDRFVEVGLTPTFIDIPNCDSSFCGNTTFEDVVYIISKSKGFIGIDSSMAHIANAVDCSSIIILGKYKSFNSYMPFSGISKNNKFIVIQKDGVIAKDIEVKELNDNFEKYL